jgi:hypothetical protein
VDLLDWISREIHWTESEVRSGPVDPVSTLVFPELRNPCLCAGCPCWFEPPDTLKIAPGIRRMEDKSSDFCSGAIYKLVVLVKFHPPLIDLSTEEVIDCW